MVGRAVSIAFQTDKPLAAYGELGEAVEGFGFDAVSVYNDLFFQPAWPALFEIARHTTRIRLGPAAVNPFLTHPITIAGHIALLDELSQGRAYLGLARGGWLDHLGINPDRPITAVREAFAAIRHLLAQNKAPFRGSLFSLAGGERLRWSIPRNDIPFLLGSWGQKMITACIDQVVEVKVGGTANPAVVRQIKELISRAARAKGLDPEEITLVVGAVTVVDLDGQAARDLARREVALYLPIVARLDPTLNLEPAWLQRLAAAAAGHQLAQAAALVSDEMLDRVAFAGTPDAVIRQAEALFDAGAGRVEFGTPHGISVKAGLALLGEPVLQAIGGP
jgi:5,10-methylenetetrahydromethanopterin reductase